MVRRVAVPIGFSVHRQTKTRTGATFDEPSYGLSRQLPRVHTASPPRGSIRARGDDGGENGRETRSVGKARAISAAGRRARRPSR
ncbi:hypothetical protein PAHAL_2G082100 [Panicum hallii]|uniref:Uncharacterized protein n=1 Tax=Panicum hallii TaxID=206008 RepID=A0A2S3GWS4_9POAL|nr:hypothetical protein PAHAL_2G082100 [Panicum hallii]